MITIKTESLRAAILCAAVKDVRYYLKGVCLRVKDDGRAHVAATDGTCAFEDVSPELSALIGASVTIPIDVAKVLAKTKSPMISFVLREDKKWESEEAVFVPRDGTFPDTDRIFPAKGAGEPGAHYDFELLAKGQKALQTARNAKSGKYRLTTIKGVGLMAPEDSEFPRFAVMPLREPACWDAQ